MYLKKYFCVFLLIFSFNLLAEDLLGQIGSYDDKHVILVRTGSFNFLPDIEVEDLFNKAFETSGEWWCEYNVDGDIKKVFALYIIPNFYDTEYLFEFEVNYEKNIFDLVMVLEDSNEIDIDEILEEISTIYLQE